MSLLITANVNVAKLPKEKFIKGKDGSIWYNITISVNDESRFGNNVWLYDSQTKEEREAKKNKHTLGNGRVVWTDGNVILAEQDKTVTEPVLEKAKEDLPF
jgi:hypothetical protein